MAHAGVAVGARGADAWGWPLAHDGRRSGVMGSLRIAGWPVAHDAWGQREWPFAHDQPWQGSWPLGHDPLSGAGGDDGLRLDLEGGPLRTMGAGLGVAVCARWRHVCRVK